MVFYFELNRGKIMKIFKTCYKSAIGPFEIAGTEKGIVSATFIKDERPGDAVLPSCLKECFRQLDEYFKGKRRKFAVDLLLQGTDFQKTVWRQLEKIPYGKTASYREIAVTIGKPNAYRAVGNANGKNPLAIIIPCHRVIGSNGDLVGYGGGLWRKEWLLKHERSRP